MTCLLGQTTATEPAALTQQAGQAMGPIDLSLLGWNGWDIEVRIGVLWLVVAVLIGVAIWWLLPWIRRKWLKGYRTRAVKLTFKGLALDPVRVAVVFVRPRT